jgi:hypothetical protein
MRRRTRYSRAILQFEANRWTRKLKELGYQLPAARITVYTSGIYLELALGHPIVDYGPALGVALSLDDGTPVVFVRLPRGRQVNADPLEVLIHELLHHVTPTLTHEEINRLAPWFRLEDSDALLPDNPMTNDVETSDGFGGCENLTEEIGMDLLDRLYLDANGYIKKPPRSLLTGRFV